MRMTLPRSPRRCLHLCTLLALLTTSCASPPSSSPPAQAQQLAFPTAEGFGRFAQGGRGGKAYNINSLSAGVGSGGSCNAGGCGGSAPFSAGTVTFRDCLTDRFGVGKRTCIFRVGGVIDYGQAEHPWDVPPFVTVAGQTAPGNGMMIRGLSLLFYNTHDIIVRHMRHRNRPYTSNDYSFQVVGGYGCVACIFDHISFGWNSDDGHWCSYNNTDRCTFQWSLSTEGVTPSTTGDYNKCCGAASTSPNPPTYGGVSFLHNFYAQHMNRVPWAASTSIQFVNVVVYNVGDASAIFSNGYTQAPQADWTNNYYKTGPQQSDPTRVTLALASACTSPTPGCQQLYADWAAQSKIYLSGNYQNILRPNNTYPEDAFIVRWYSGVPLNVVTTRPAHFPTIPSMVPAVEAANQVNAKVGAYATTNPPRRDTIDQRGIDSFLKNTGGSLTGASMAVICSDGKCGETGSYPAGTPYVDTDGDGIADAWEDSHPPLDKNNPADGPATAPNGYSNLENFLNKLAGDPVAGSTRHPAPKTLRVVGE